MFTSSAEVRDLRASYQLGVNSYVVKPMDFDQFAKPSRRSAFTGCGSPPAAGRVKVADTSLAADLAAKAGWVGSKCSPATRTGPTGGPSRSAPKPDRPPHPLEAFGFEGFAGLLPAHYAAFIRAHRSSSVIGRT